MIDDTDKKSGFYVISVESRKGGVGKTTAALNLASILLEKKHAVLFLDLDFTGTNTADVVEDSYYWKNTVNVIKTEGKKKSSVNLLSEFNSYLAGIEPAKWINQYRANKVNLIGSQIFDEDQKTIINPSFLLDEIYLAWLKEYLEQIINKFIGITKVERNFQTIIFDNSPGFIGLANLIHEWLIELGPKIGKFIFLSSLDKQDIKACANTMLSLNQDYQNVYKAVKAYRDAKESNKELQLDEENSIQKDFFMKMISHENHSASSLQSMEIYQKDLSSVNQLIVNPTGYQCILINKIPDPGFMYELVKKINSDFLKQLDTYEISVNNLILVDKTIDDNFNFSYFSDFSPDQLSTKTINSLQNFIGSIKETINIFEKKYDNTFYSQLDSNRIDISSVLSQHVEIVRNMISRFKGLFNHPIPPWIEETIELMPSIDRLANLFSRFIESFIHENEKVPSEIDASMGSHPTSSWYAYIHNITNQKDFTSNLSKVETKYRQILRYSMLNIGTYFISNLLLLSRYDNSSLISDLFICFFENQVQVLNQYFLENPLIEKDSTMQFAVSMVLVNTNKNKISAPILKNYLKKYLHQNEDEMFLKSIEDIYTLFSFIQSKYLMLKEDTTFVVKFLLELLNYPDMLTNSQLKRRVKLVLNERITPPKNGLTFIVSEYKVEKCMESFEKPLKMCLRMWKLI